jgi:hypothetical protein
VCRNWNEEVAKVLGKEGPDFWAWIDYVPHDEKFKPASLPTHAVWAIERLRDFFPHLGVQMQWDQDGGDWHCVLYPKARLSDASDSPSWGHGPTFCAAICRAIVGVGKTKPIELPMDDNATRKSIANQIEHGEVESR